MARGTVRLSRPDESRHAHQSVTLLEAIEEFRFDALIGGARRDEEKARAKERFFSYRDSFGQWDPKSQRPEIWNLYNGRINQEKCQQLFTRWLDVSQLDAAFICGPHPIPDHLRHGGCAVILYHDNIHAVRQTKGCHIIRNSGDHEAYGLGIFVEELRQFLGHWPKKLSQ